MTKEYIYFMNTLHQLRAMEVFPYDDRLKQHGDLFHDIFL
jgi:hypothetical protein